MSAREAIFASIRRSLGVTGAEGPRRFEVKSRLAETPAGVVPERGQGDVEARVATFKAEAARVQASVSEVESLAAAPADVARFLRDSNCPASLRMGADERLWAMPWSAIALEILLGASDGHDANAVSMAFAGIAESGTLALVSGPANPTTLNFLPTTTSSCFEKKTSWRITRASSPDCGRLTGKADRPARSISSPARRDRAISNRP
jgi:L-lactate dehydrogenase complex protein LldG